MRKLALSLCFAALLLATARLFTGVVYGADSPVAYFVIKTAPDARMERPEAKGPPVGTEIVLDIEETQLAYGWLYFGLMRSVPLLAVAMVASAALLWIISLRRGAAPRSKAGQSPHAAANTYP